jgi:hypothetical protein
MEFYNEQKKRHKLKKLYYRVSLLLHPRLALIVSAGILSGLFQKSAYSTFYYDRIVLYIYIHVYYAYCISEAGFICEEYCLLGRIVVYAVESR